MRFAKCEELHGIPNREEASGDMKNSRYVRYYLAGAVSLTTFLVYLSSLQDGFVAWDDTYYVLDNPHIRSLGADFFRWAFFDFYASNWHPLTWISHALDYAVWGLNPLGHHLTNNILHVANTFIVVLLVMKLLEAANRPQHNAPSAPPLNFSPRRIRPGAERGGWGELNPTFTLIAAGTTGLLFGLHPLHVESVAWVAERKDLLCAFFYLLSIIMYMKFAMSAPGSRFTIHDSRSARFLFYALCLFILALLSKPMAVSLPVVLLLLDWYPLERFRSFRAFLSALLEKLPLILLSIASSAITVVAQKTGGAMEPLRFVPLTTRLLVAGRSLSVYLWKMVMPLDLVPFYPYPQDASFLSPQYLFALLLAAAMTIACLAAARRQKVWLAAWGYYIVTLLPVIGIVQVGSQSMADRYTYLPSIGPFLIAGVVAAGAYGKMARGRKRSLPKLAGGIAAVVLLTSMSYLTVQQVHVWKNGMAFWSYVIEKEPLEVAIAYNNRGFVFLGEGKTKNAIEDFQTALRVEPVYAEARNNLCIAYKSAGLYSEAVKQCQRAVGIRPDYAEAYNNMGAAYKAEGMSDAAIEQFRIALRLKPDYAEPLFNLGIIYLDRGDLEIARKCFEYGLRIKPDDYRAQEVLNQINSR